MQHFGIKIAPLALGISLLASAAQAQQSALTAADFGLSEAQLGSLLQSGSASAPTPGIAFGSPVAFGAHWGDIGLGIGGATLPKTAADDYDGSAGLVFGLGNAETFVGLETIVNVISLREDFGDDGSVAFKVHTQLPGGAALAVGVENTLRWGDARRSESSAFIAMSKTFDLATEGSLPLAVTLGLGDSRFNDPGESGAQPFGAIALIPHEQLSLILDYPGTGLNVGASLVPLRGIPLIVSLGYVNVTERNRSDAEFAGGVGYSFRF